VLEHWSSIPAIAGQKAKGKRQKAKGKWQMANGKWQMANGKWQKAKEGIFGSLSYQNPPV
jgi:hypothetical protein